MGCGQKGRERTKRCESRCNVYECGEKGDAVGERGRSYGGRNVETMEVIVETMRSMVCEGIEVYGVEKDIVGVATW